MPLNLNNKRIQFIKANFLPQLEERVTSAVTDYAAAVTDINLFEQLHLLQNSEGDTLETTPVEPGSFIFNLLAEYDPTNNKEYFQQILIWILGSQKAGNVYWSDNEYLNKAEPHETLEQIFAPEDWPQIKRDLELFHHIKNKPSAYKDCGDLRNGKTDIRHYRKFKDFAKMLEPFRNTAQLEIELERYNNAALEALHAGGADFIAGDHPQTALSATKHGWTLLRIKSEETAKSLGKNSDWCTTWGQYERYKNDLLWLHNTQTGEKFQISLQHSQWMNWQDEAVAPEDLISQHKGLDISLYPHIITRLKNLTSEQAPSIPGISSNILRVELWRSKLSQPKLLSDMLNTIMDNGNYTACAMLIEDIKIQSLRLGHEITPDLSVMQRLLMSAPLDNNKINTESIIGCCAKGQRAEEMAKSGFLVETIKNWQEHKNFHCVSELAKVLRYAHPSWETEIANTSIIPQIIEDSYNNKNFADCRNILQNFLFRLNPVFAQQLKEKNTFNNLTAQSTEDGQEDIFSLLINTGFNYTAAGQQWQLIEYPIALNGCLTLAKKARGTFIEPFFSAINSHQLSDVFIRQQDLTKILNAAYSQGNIYVCSSILKLLNAKNETMLAKNKTIFMKELCHENGFITKSLSMPDHCSRQFSMAGNIDMRNQLDHKNFLELCIELKSKWEQARNCNKAILPHPQSGAALPHP